MIDNLRISPKAQIVSADKRAKWRAFVAKQFSADLSPVEGAILTAVAGFTPGGVAPEWKLDVDGMPRQLRTSQEIVSRSVDHLIDLCLLGVEPGAGDVAKKFKPALPKWLADGGFGEPALVPPPAWRAVLASSQHGNLITKKSSSRAAAFVEAKALLDQAAKRDDYNKTEVVMIRVELDETT
jgi:hypothetical protein